LNKVLITGACGYLGARISMHLAKEGYKVTTFDSIDPSSYSQWVSLMDEVVVGDIRDESTISDLADKNFDVVVHLISLDHHKSNFSPNFVSSINIMPIWNLLDKFTQNGLDRFIYFSTIHVYGKLPKKMVTEDQPTSPLNAYGLTHLLSENICNYYNKITDTKCINIRLSNSYGSPIFKENNCWWLVINDLCKTAIENNEIKLKSDGSPQRDFIHGDDVARAIEVLLNTDISNTPNNTYHISSGDTLTIWEIANTVKKVYQDRFKSSIQILLPENTTPLKPNKFSQIENYTISNTNIKSLGFVPINDLKTGINEIFDYLQKK
jgi:UDP-glucose 4-epimerase